MDDEKPKRLTITGLPPVIDDVFRDLELRLATMAVPAPVMPAAGPVMPGLLRGRRVLGGLIDLDALLELAADEALREQAAREPIPIHVPDAFELRMRAMRGDTTSPTVAFERQVGRELNRQGVGREFRIVVTQGADVTGKPTVRVVLHRIRRRAARKTGTLNVRSVVKALEPLVPEDTRVLVRMG